MGWVRRLLHRPAATVAFTVSVALAGAVAVHFLRRALAATAPEWVDLVDDIIKSVVLVGVVGLGTVWLDEQRRTAAREAEAADRIARNRVIIRRLANTGFNIADGGSAEPGAGPPTVRAAREELVAHAAKFRELAEKIRKAHAGEGIQQMDVILVNIDLAGYCAEGQRVRTSNASLMNCATWKTDPTSNGLQRSPSSAAPSATQRLGGRSRTGSSSTGSSPNEWLSESP